MLEISLLFAQANPQIQNDCSLQFPAVVCKKDIVRAKNKPLKYFLTISNGSVPVEVNRCTFLGNNLKDSFRYIPNQKWCPNEK